MSYVTSIAIMCSSMETAEYAPNNYGTKLGIGPIDMLNEWLTDAGHNPLHQTESVGYFEGELWKGAANKMDVDAFVSIFSHVRWAMTHSVILLLNTNGGTTRSIPAL